MTRQLLTLLQPLDDGRVVGRGSGECVERQLAPQTVGQLAVGAEFGEDRLVLVGTGRRPPRGRGSSPPRDHRRTTDVDEFDRRMARERVEVGDHEVERLDAVLRHIGAGARRWWGRRAAAMDFGCNVTTRWSRMAGTPVMSATSVTGIPAPAMAFAVPPLDTSATPSSWRTEANSTIPVLSYTDNSARISVPLR